MTAIAFYCIAVLIVAVAFVGAMVHLLTKRTVDFADTCNKIHIANLNRIRELERRLSELENKP